VCVGVCGQRETHTHIRRETERQGDIDREGREGGREGESLWGGARAWEGASEAGSKWGREDGCQ
jgi:hypothetical protein